MLRGEQALLIDDGRPGYRLGDGLLMPAPLRRIIKKGNSFSVAIASPGLPELLAIPAGNA
jgi:hypothetical protein